MKNDSKQAEIPRATTRYEECVTAMKRWGQFRSLEQYAKDRLAARCVDTTRGNTPTRAEMVNLAQLDRGAVRALAAAGVRYDRSVPRGCFGINGRRDRVAVQLSPDMASPDGHGMSINGVNVTRPQWLAISAWVKRMGWIDAPSIDWPDPEDVPVPMAMAAEALA